MDTLWLDVKHGIRTLARTPGLTVIAVITVALGIGANTGMFSVVHGVLLSPLPYPESHRLVRLTETIRRNEVNVSYPNFLDWRARSYALQEVATYNPFFSVTLTGVERAELLPGAAAESQLFRLLGVQPVLGRIFAEEEERPGGPSAVLISHSLWERQFGRDPNIIGRSIRLEMTPATVIGVLPPEFRLARADIWFPLGPVLNRNMLDRGNHPGFQAFGRLRPGVTLEQAREEMNAIAAALEQEYPASNKNVGIRVRPLLNSLVGRVQPMLVVLLGTVSFVLLIACANVSNMLLARALGRSREVAVRAALGAGTSRLFRLFLVESLLLGLLGGAGGLLVAWWGVDALLAAQPGVIPRAAEIGIQAPVLLYGLAVTLLCSAIFGTVPAWRAMRANLVDALKQGVRGAGRSGSTRLRWALVTSQVALSMVLLIGAGLMLRTLLALSSVDPGFRADGLLAYKVHLPGQSYDEPE
ncbi:MAG TPA: ABC transporter permease, partial [Candidatus Acidoferrales bacterium]